MFCIFEWISIQVSHKHFRVEGSKSGKQACTIIERCLTTIRVLLNLAKGRDPFWTSPHNHCWTNQNTTFSGLMTLIGPITTWPEQIPTHTNNLQSKATQGRAQLQLSKNLLPSSASISTTKVANHATSELYCQAQHQLQLD